MDMEQGREVLAQALAAYRARSYADLAARIDASVTSEVTGPDGQAWQIEIRIFWDDRPHGAVRVMGSIDDGGLRAFFPLTDSFILAPDGSFVDEGGTQ